MKELCKRLGLGVGLIAAAAAILLFTDQGRRTADAARPLPRVAILQLSAHPILEDAVAGMLQGLREGGFTDGATVSVRRYDAGGDIPTANTIAREIVGSGFDLALTATTPALQAFASANREGRVIHVFSVVTDPYAAGVGLDPADPLRHPRHLVGYGSMQPVAETFQIARRMFPGLSRVGVVWNPAEANSRVSTERGREVCKELGIELLEATVDATAAVGEAARSLVARGVQALWIGGDSTVMAAVEVVVGAGAEAGIPTFTCQPGSTDKGALFDLGADYGEVGHIAGRLAARILGGLDPARVPIKNLMPERLLFNEKALAGLRDPWRIDEATRQLAASFANAPLDDGLPPPRPPPDRRYRMGIAYFAPDPGFDACRKGLLDGLAELGFEEGRNLTVEAAHAQGEIANIPPLLQELDGRGLDLIVPFTTPCLTAACATVHRTPVVFTFVYDPIAAGAGTSLDDHLDNVTGVGSFPPVDKTVDLVLELRPGVHRVGTVYNSSEANSRKVVEVARGAFARRGLALEEVTVSNTSEVYQAAQALVARGIELFWITGDNTVTLAFDAVVKAAREARLPIVDNDPELVPQGALACVGIGFYRSGWAAAELAARVMLGASPGALPMKNVAEEVLSLNLDVARELGVTFPEAVLKRADELVEGGRRQPRRKSDGREATPAAPAGGGR